MPGPNRPSGETLPRGFDTFESAMLDCAMNKPLHLARPTAPDRGFRLPMRRRGLKFYLDRLVATYDHRFLSTDPLAFVHRYPDPEDQEIAGMVSSALAYGNVPAIRRSVDDALSRLGPRPSRTLDACSEEDLQARCRRFRHRFTTARDLAALLGILRGIRRSHGSVQGFFLEGYARSAPTLREALVSFVERALRRDLKPFYGGTPPQREGVRFLLPSPRRGSGCKRLNLYLRWMVRRADGVDLGLWREVEPRQLLMPVDTHVARIASYIGLTRRKSPGWAMTEEITAALRAMDPVDPVRYDFALCRLGILDACPRHQDAIKCAACPLQPVCLL